ncbi:hypothetical protein [Streptomyces odonnellii]|uniref:hypothetical protein n=1 Tax=Streptomyces odonnellii TaxID=1417980 RepID=UPI000626C91D|nr:hypothetical protein [Streptomyces odonnellii]
MTAQPVYPPPGPVAVIPHTIGAIGDALTGEKRLAFYAEVLATEEHAVPAVMRRWWMTAMLNSAPDAERSRADTQAGRNLVSVDQFLDRVDGTAL